MINKKMIHRITIKSLFSALLKSDTFPIALVNNGKANSMHLLIVMKCFSLFHTSKYLFFNYFYVFKMEIKQSYNM